MPWMREWLGQGLAHGEARVERAVGVLEDDLHLAPQGAHLAGARPVMSGPRSISPEVGSSRRMMERPSVVLPQPDSPTRPSVSPRRMVNETPSTAWTVPTTLPQQPPHDRELLQPLDAVRAVVRLCGRCEDRERRRSCVARRGVHAAGVRGCGSGPDGVAARPAARRSGRRSMAWPQRSWNRQPVRQASRLGTMPGIVDRRSRRFWLRSGLRDRFEQAFV
jgi:hypothetical protein